MRGEHSRNAAERNPTDGKAGPRMNRIMIYEERTKLARRGLFEVQNEVGLGRREEAYHQAFRIWLEGLEVPHQSKAPHYLNLDGGVAHTLHPDFVLWDAITVE